MADGLTIRHPQTGSVIFSATTVNSHSRALITTSGSAGSQTVANLLRGSPFIIQALPTDATPNYNVPDFTISGSTVSWNSAARYMRVLIGSFAGAAPSTAPVTTAGLVIRNPVTGAVQVSALDTALQLASYGALVLERSLSPSPLPMARGTITVTGVNPVVAFRVQDGRAAGIDRIVANGGGSFTFHFQAQSASPVGLVYWVFDTAASALKLDTDCALVVRDTLNVKLFDSRAYALKIVTLKETAPQPGLNLDLEQTTNQPSGSTYAVIQSSIGWSTSMADLGGYGYGDYPPANAEIGDPQNPRAPGVRWAYMQLLSHMTTARFSGSTLSTGLTVFERWTDWYEASTVPTSNQAGRARHTIIDVTGLPSAAMPNPNAPAVSVSASKRSISVVSATAVTTTTPSVSLNISGGTAPYSVAWSRKTGSALVAANGSTNSTTFSTRLADQPSPSFYSAEWAAEVTDALGATTQSDAVLFEHTVQEPDLRPDGFTLNAINPSTNNPTLADSWSNAALVTGITASITLRIERYNPTGSLGGGMIVVQRADSASGPWTTVSSFDPQGAGYRYGDVTVTNGQYVRYGITGATTTAGRKQLTFGISVWNISLSPTETIGTQRACSITVDADDDYYPADLDPDPVDWPNVSGSTTEMSGDVNSATRTISGINQDIVLRATLSNVVLTGSPVNGAGSSTFAILTSGGNAGSAGLGSGYFASRSVSNGQTVSFRSTLVASSAALAATASYTVTVTNHTTGAVLDTFTVSQTANAVDQTPNAMTWPNQSWTTVNASTSGAYNNVGPTISGINRTTRLRFQLNGVSNNLTTSGWRITSIVGGVHTNLTSAIAMSNGASAEIDVASGTNLTFKMDGSTTNGVRSASGTVTVTNVSTGGTVLGSFSFAVTVDSANATDVTADAITAFTALSPTSNDERAFVTGNFRQIKGVSKDVTLRVTVSGYSGNLSSWMVRSYRNKPGVGSSGGPWDVMGDITTNGGSVEFTISNNQWIYFLVEGRTTSGRRSGGWNVTVTNVTDGNAVIGTFRSDIVADNDDNHNVLSVSLNRTAVSGHALGAPGEWLTAYASGQLTATVTGGVGNVSLTWEKLSGLGSGWSVTGTTGPSFAYYGQANFNVTATYRLKVTDSVRTVYSPTVTVNLTGGPPV